ncbi:hypothetical protein HK097_000805, partial [Rhizophlyctis rosea]
MRTILIDCGKTFYEAALNWFVHYRLRNIDAVILTHGHADAMLGMDDLRQWTIGGKKYSVQDHIDVYLNRNTAKVVEGTFPYLFDKRKATGGGDIPSLQFHIFGDGPEGYEPFMIEELEVIPFQVEHGYGGDGKFMSLGYRLGNVTYISDASGLPEKARKCIAGTDILVLDALHYDSHPSHFSISESIKEASSLLSPGSHLYITGLSHRVDHDTLNQELADSSILKEHGILAETAYDGLRIVVDDLTFGASTINSVTACTEGAIESDKRARQNLPSHLGDIMSSRETTTLLPDTFSRLERVILMANGNVQRILSAYYNSTVTVDILSNEKIDVDANMNSRETIFKREVNLVCLNQICCNAKSTVTITSSEYLRLIEEQQVGIGQLFR